MGTARGATRLITFTDEDGSRNLTRTVDVLNVVLTVANVRLAPPALLARLYRLVPFLFDLGRGFFATR